MILATLESCSFKTSHHIDKRNRLLCDLRSARRIDDERFTPA